MTKDELLERIKDLPGNALIVIPDFSGYEAEQDGFYSPLSIRITSKDSPRPVVEIE